MSHESSLTISHTVDPLIVVTFPSFNHSCTVQPLLPKQIQVQRVPMSSAEVSLAIYDLSGGMARSLSAQFLGPNHAIDIIPHTGIIAFGKEYYFGGSASASITITPTTAANNNYNKNTIGNTIGGIVMNATPHDFQSSHNITPIQILSLGQTNITQSSFESWCIQMMSNGTYAGYNYDLLQRNCNHFSHDAALKGLNLQQGVPDWILNVPNQFLSSPMGQLIRPMLEQMQVTGPSSSGGMNSSIVSTSSGGGNMSNTLSLSSTMSSSVPDDSYNPWADLGSTATTTTSTTTTSTTSTTTTTSNNHATNKAMNSFNEIKTPILDSYNKPLISNDTNVVNFCIQKLKTSNCFNDFITNNNYHDDNEPYSKILNDLELVLTKTNKGQNLSVSKVLTSSCSLLLCPFQKDHPSSFSLISEKLYSLMLLRLVILEPLISIETYENILLGVYESMTKNDNNHDEQIASRNKKVAANRSMFWCLMSNAIGNEFNNLCVTNVNDTTSSFFQQITSKHEHFLQNLVELSIMDLSFDSTTTSATNSHQNSVRESASAFLYNFILAAFYNDTSIGIHYSHHQDDKNNEVLSDILVTIICGIIEGLDTQLNDVTTTMRKLLVIGKIVKSKFHQGVHNKDLITSVSVSLLIDLGCEDLLSSMIKDEKDLSKNLSMQFFNLAKEIIVLLQASQDLV